jgi:hypothetical protein
MTRALPFTAASLARAIKGVEKAGLRVRRVTVKPDGSITVESGGTDVEPIDSRETSPAASWDDA